MSEMRLAEIEYRWTCEQFDCDDLKEVFAEVRRLQAELAAAKKAWSNSVDDLAVAVAYAGASS